MTEPILSTELTTQFSNLPCNYQRLFVKLFRFMFDYLMPVRLFTSQGGVLYNYWLVNQEREANNLSVRELDLLTCLYINSTRGRATIRTDWLKEQFPGFSNRTFNSLKQKGFITRHTWDPIAPAYRAYRSHRPIFIRISPLGIRTIKQVESNLRRKLYSTTFTNVTTTP